jgi:ribosomal protein S18 acetylase RimI-like enzyme
MQPWTLERGSLWALEAGGGLPPLCAARVAAECRELGPADADALAGAMGLAAPAVVYERLQSGRRCFGMFVGGQLATYGWVSCGPEEVGELERAFHVAHDEAYIWDCATVNERRGQRCYSALLSHMVYQLCGEGRSRIWIGASRQNYPSIRGFINAGFTWVLDLTYRRIYRLTMLRIYRAPTVGRALLAAAYRLLLNSRERRLGPLAVGFR